MPGIYGMVNRMPPSAVVTTLLLDAYPSASFAYSFRKLRTLYLGSAIRLRGADTTQGDIGFSGNNFDTGAAATFVSTHGASTIVTWYDQSGNGADITQATAANQPAYSATGLNSLPTSSFTAASDHYLRTASLYTGINGVTEATAGVIASLNTSADSFCGFINFVGSAGISDPDYVLVDSWSILERGSANSNQSASMSQNANTASNNVTYDTPFHSSSMVATGGTAGSFKIDNGTSATITASATFGTSAGGVMICMGARQLAGTAGAVSSTNSLQGQISEAVFWPADQTANRTAIYSNQKTYWGTP